FRFHEGTVYSIDVFWTSGAEPSPTAKKKKQKSNKIHSSDSSALTMVSGSHDQTISVCDVSKFSERNILVKQTKTLNAHTADVYALELLPASPLPEITALGNMVSAGDYTLRTWNVENGANLATLHGHTGYVSCLKTKGKRAFSGSWDTTIRSWNLETRRPMHVFRGHTNIVNCIDITDTDIFSGSWDMTLIQWSRAVLLESPYGVFQGHTDGVQCLQVSSDTLFSGSMDKTVRLWSIKTGKAIKILKGHIAGIECLQVFEKYLFSGSYDKTIRCYDIETGSCLTVFDGHTDGVYCLKYFDGLLFSGSGDKTIRAWDATELEGTSKQPWWRAIFSFFGGKK
ncbi:WD40-repeat-containing domain protein, partial [Chytridium lagenaria]